MAPTSGFSLGKKLAVVAPCLLALASALPQPLLPRILPPLSPTAITQVCQEISNNITSASAVRYPSILNTLLNDPSIDHWFQSSEQQPICVVDVGSVQDTANVMRIIHLRRPPFAVMSGGHASNVGFSSTTGVHISLRRMKQVVLSPDHSTVEVGFGNLWADVLDALEPHGLNVVGGRVPGPGVGGFTLGGGYSWKTSQYGLTVDTVRSYTVVLPNGTVAQASSTQNQDLFFALKGGMNRFGVVTSAVIETHPQPPTIYGGFAIYGPLQVPALVNATAAFSAANTDPKSQIITIFNGATAMVIFFHDGPTKPAEFQAFDGILPLVSEVRPRTFKSFIQGNPSELAQPLNVRGTFATFSTTGLNRRYIEAVKNETDLFAAMVLQHGSLTVNFDVQTFTDFGVHATESAWPHAGSPVPLNLYFTWALASEDAYWRAQMSASIARLKAVAIQEGLWDSSCVTYPNYALAGTSSDELYGSVNAARLRSIRDDIDPTRVMELTGGFTL